jgi:PAS domain S-box-containing protein
MMKDKDKTKEQLINELGKMRQQVAVTETLEMKRKNQEKARKELEATKISEDEAREYAESIINTVREPLIVLDQDLRVVSVSRSFYEVFKVNPKETVGQLIYDLGNKQWNIPKLRELLETILPQKTTFDNYEVEHDFAAIGRRIMLLNARQIQRVLGKERIILLAIEDITERREIESGLEKARKELEATKISEDEAREYAESIINTVREPLIVLDQDLRVVSVSRSFYEVFKVNPKETVGQLIYDLGNKQWNIPKLRELLETILPQKTTFDNYEVEHDFATIGRRIMLLNARQIQRVLGKERIILLAIEDITERKRMEEELAENSRKLEQANIRLQEVDRLKSIFLASMSHELRTPLNSIIGFTGIILQGMSGEINQEQRKQLTMVRNSANHLLSLINDVLDVSRIEAGRVELSPEEMRLDDVVKEVAEAFSPAVSEKDLEFLTEVPEDILLLSDRRRVKQVLMNLVSNAIKFTDRGSVKIAARVARDGNVDIRVIDTGIGVKKEDTDKLFQPFQQIDTSLTRSREGTGLGLHIAKRLAALLGGDISAKSEYGRGSEFIFTIPLSWIKLICLSKMEVGMISGRGGQRG